MRTLHHLTSSTPLAARRYSIPAKQTDEVDLASPVAQLIRNSYGEDPKSHAEALNALNRARQDAVRGAGSDATGEPTRMRVR